MSIHEFCTHIAITDGILIEDFECVVEVRVDPDGCGGLDVIVVAVWAEMLQRRADGPPFGTGRVDLLRHQDQLAQLIGNQVAKASETDPRIADEAIARAGFFYAGRGGSDPDGRWVRRAAA